MILQSIFIITVYYYVWFVRFLYFIMWFNVNMVQSCSYGLCKNSSLNNNCRFQRFPPPATQLGRRRLCVRCGRRMIWWSYLATKSEHEHKGDRLWRSLRIRYECDNVMRYGLAEVCQTRTVYATTDIICFSRRALIQTQAQCSECNLKGHSHEKIQMFFLVQFSREYWIKNIFNTLNHKIIHDKSYLKK